MRRHVLRVYRRHDDRRVGDLGRVAAVSPDEPANLTSDSLRESDGRDEVRTDVSLDVSPPSENTKTLSAELRRLTLSHSEEFVAHPSSLARAVSSLTLSVGA